SVEFPFEAAEPRDYTAQIVKLEESIGRISVTSNPSDAQVFLDGELRGNTPVDLNRVCAGEHRLEVKHATGKYVEDISVGADESLSFECPIRPTLAVLDVVADEAVPARDVADIRERLASELRQLQAMNVLFPEAGRVRNLLGERGPAVFVPGKATPEASADARREWSEKLGEELEVEAILIPYVAAQRLTKDVVLHFLAVGSITPDRYTLNYLDREALPAFVEKLSTPTKLFGSWIGVTAIDTRLRPGPTVLSVDSTGPASAAGIQIGDVLLEVDGTPVAFARELLDRVHVAEPGGRIELTVSRAGVTESVPIEVGTTPLEVPVKDADFLYNKAIIDLRHRMVVEPEIENLARLNAGLCYMQLEDYETALKEYLPRVTLPETAGISLGTVQYHTALAYLRLGEREEAARLFAQAMAHEEATVLSNDGPKVAPLAQRRLRELGRESAR
ncbi:MAG TPA: PDZ domain-containing protein, partial [Vicinamibacteria bacterium]|nr:PDZ domain-containing protein [Vicinamibacteria bacterium]